MEPTFSMLELELETMMSEVALLRPAEQSWRTSLMIFLGKLWMSVRDVDGLSWCWKCVNSFRLVMEWTGTMGALYGLGEAVTGRGEAVGAPGCWGLIIRK